MHQQEDQRSRALHALSLYRQGSAKSVSAAARRAGTTLQAMWEFVPNALIKNSRTGRLEIKETDEYSAQVQILAEGGAMVVTARGSRQRELAGQHRATIMRVLAGKEDRSALAKYRNRKIGGLVLVSDYSRLTMLAQAGVVGELESLYVSPDVSA